MSLEATAGSTETEAEQDMGSQDTLKNIRGLSSTSPARTELHQPLFQHSLALTGDRQRERKLGKLKEEMRAKRLRKASVRRHLLMCKSLF